MCTLARSLERTRDICQRVRIRTLSNAIVPVNQGCSRRRTVGASINVLSFTTCSLRTLTVSSARLIGASAVLHKRCTLGPAAPRALVVCCDVHHMHSNNRLDLLENWHSERRSSIPGCGALCRDSCGSGRMVLLRRSDNRRRNTNL